MGQNMNLHLPCLKPKWWVVVGFPVVYWAPCSAGAEAAAVAQHQQLQRMPWNQGSNGVPSYTVGNARHTIPILLTFIYLVALNLWVNNQLNSLSNIRT